MSDKIDLIIDGSPVRCAPHDSVIQAYAHSGAALTANVGCMGQGVCGSCRCLVRRAGERETRTLLACETRAEPGMQVSFIDYFAPAHVHHYQMAQLGDAWQLLEQLAQTFPQAAHCRHCGGCDRACPRGLNVQGGVALARNGQLAAAAAVFDHCVMCNLCTLACPENIRPNHLGLFVRRALAAQQTPPADLLRTLQLQQRGELAVDASVADHE